MTNILLIGRHEEILQTLLRLIRNNEQWAAKAAFTDKEAMILFDQFQFDLVLLSSGIPDESEEKLRAYFRDKNPLAIIIQHYGGGSGLLSNEILQALAGKRNGLQAG